MPEAKGEGESGGRKAVFQRSGAPGDVRSPADGSKQPEFTSGVKRSRRRASDAGRTACLAQTGLRVLRESCKVRNNSPTKSGQAPRSPDGGALGGAGACRQCALPKMAEVRKGRDCEALACLADAARSADAVQVCPVGPTCGGRLLSGLRRTVVSKEGFPDDGGEQQGARSRPKSVFFGVLAPER